MAVQFAGKALDAWLTTKIKEAQEVYDKREDLYSLGCLHAWQATQKQLHEFWGASLAIKGEDLCGND